MTKLTYRLLLIQSFALLTAFAQPAPISSIRIYTVPDGARFYVDGQVYYASQTFLWAQGSKHILQYPVQIIDGVPTGYQQSLDGNVRYTFGGWQDNRGILQPQTSTTQTITADPAVTSLVSTLNVQYHVALRFSTGPIATPGCGAPGDAPQDGIRAGLVFLTGCLGSNADLWLTPGAYPMTAFPYPGWVFSGWNINGTITSSYISNLNVTGALTIQPIFQLAKRVQFVTAPFGLQMIIDRTPTPTSGSGNLDGGAQLLPGATPCQANNVALPPNPPSGLTGLCYGEFDFLPGSQHVVAAMTPQYDASGHLWVFGSFSNGLTQNSVYMVPTTLGNKDVITANFVPGIQAAFLTNPGGLKLSVDGRDNWQNYNFIWATGTVHSITAPDTQVDSKGRRWNFQSWSNSGPATQSFTAGTSNPNGRLTANYVALGQVKVTTNPPGIKLQVDGADCISPCTVDRPAGTQIAIAAPPSIPQSGTSRIDFIGWSDGGPSSRPYTFGSNANTIVANYATSYRVIAMSDPANGVDLRFDPPSTDLFYPGDTTVTVTATAKPGFRFRRWGGDVSGVYPVSQLNISGPQTVLAMLDRVPYIAPAGIRNAAAPTGDGTVAPGSIISIIGESLASDTQTGPSNPLAQTIAGVVVTVNDRILPLLFVSPQQINAQILSDLPDGDYTLHVMSANQATVTGTFTISRNAPGLFLRSPDDRPFSLATHEDGTPITPDSPALAGETVSIFGTGFGPYNQQVIDGFVVPTPSNIAVADTVEVTAADQPVQTVFSGAAPGFVGTTVTKIKIDDSMPKSSNVEVTVKVNGKASNKVLLPVQ